MINFLFYIIIFTISFDIFLVFNFGFNFRISQLLLLILFIYTFYIMHRSQKVIIPIGIKWLLIWSIFIFLFVPNSNYLPRNIGYCIWLLFSVLQIFCLVCLINTEQKLKQIIKCYIYSYFFVSIFGLFQFVLGIIGITPPLIEQWWIPGVPRINGFSYEPSYFATYIIMGMIFTYCLIRWKINLIPMYQLKGVFCIEALATILAGSRMGWGILICLLLEYPVLFIFEICKGKLKKSSFNRITIFMLIFLIISYTSLNFIDLDDMMFLFNGVGLFGRPSHSVDIRGNEFQDTLNVFYKSPLIGYSLGGVATAIGEMRGFSIRSMEDTKNNEGMSTFAEVLAASGIIGVIPFIIYMSILIYKPLKLAKLHGDNSFAILLKSMVISLIAELIILQFNQNILRPYLWLHIGILSALYSVAIKSKHYLNLKN